MTADILEINKILNLVVEFHNEMHMQDCAIEHQITTELCINFSYSEHLPTPKEERESKLKTSRQDMKEQKRLHKEIRSSIVGCQSRRKSIEPPSFTKQDSAKNMELIKNSNKIVERFYNFLTLIIIISNMS